MALILTFFRKGTTLLVCTDDRDPEKSVTGEDTLKEDHDMAVMPDFVQTNDEGQETTYRAVLCKGNTVYVKITRSS